MGVQRKVMIEAVIQSTTPPTVQWMCDENRVRLDTRHCITVEEQSEGRYLILLEILKAERIDCGEYKAIAKNEKGDVESTTCLLEEEMLKLRRRKRKRERRKREEKMEEEVEEKK